jgi:hypothetical protein
MLYYIDIQLFLHFFSFLFNLPEIFADFSCVDLLLDQPRPTASLSLEELVWNSPVVCFLPPIVQHPIELLFAQLVARTYDLGLYSF